MVVLTDVPENMTEAPAVKINELPGIIIEPDKIHGPVPLQFIKDLKIVKIIPDPDRELISEIVRAGDERRHMMGDPDGRFIEARFLIYFVDRTVTFNMR